MGIAFAGEPCIDPLELRESFFAQDPPLPTSPWDGLANSFRCSVGMTPGSGLVLMDKQSVNRIDLAAAHDLVFVDDSKRRVTLKGTLVRRIKDLAPGLSTSKHSPYCLWLTDKRWVLRRSPIDAGYNLRPDSGGDYISGTTNGGTAWTWQGMFADVWESCSGLGTAPTLPFTPEGTPEGFSFYGSTVWNALGCILQRITCALYYDPRTGLFSVVRLGSTDVAATLAMRKMEPPIWDDYATRPAYARLPEKVRVQFRKRPAPIDGSSLFYTIDVADTDPTSGPLTETVVRIADGLSAIYTSGSLTNLAALTTRAAERAADWFRKQKNFNRPLHRVYEGFRSEAFNVMGSTCLAVVIEDRGNGMRTEILSGPDEVGTGGGSASDPLDTLLDPSEPEDACAACGRENETDAYDLQSLPVVTKICLETTTIETGDTLPVVDTTAIVKGSADATKKLRFEVDGFTTATTRVLTPLNKDYTVEETGHASKHVSGGADSIKLDDLAAPDDNTDLNASTGAHGLLKKLDGTTTNFLRGDGSWAVPPGTASVPSAATQAEQETGSSTSVYVTPGRQQYHQSACKCWISLKYNGVGVTNTVSYNVSSVGYTSAGIYSVTINTDFSSADYAIVQGIEHQAGSGNRLVNWYSRAAGSFSIINTNQTFSTPADAQLQNDFACFGDQ